MKVFVSHSMEDQSFLDGIAKTLNPHGIELLIAEHEIDIRKTITDKIKGMISRSDFGLILLTANGFESGFVREEIGYLEAIEKPSLTIMEKGIANKYGGFKFGHDHIEFDPNRPNCKW